MKIKEQILCFVLAYLYFDLWSKVLTFEKTQKNFGFLLTYSYLCHIILLKRQTDEEDHPLPANFFAYGSSCPAHHTKGDE